MEISLKIGREDDGLRGGKEKNKIFLGIRDSVILLMWFLPTELPMYSSIFINFWRLFVILSIIKTEIFLEPLKFSKTPLNLSNKISFY